MKISERAKRAAKVIDTLYYLGMLKGSRKQREEVIQQAIDAAIAENNRDADTVKVTAYSDTIIQCLKCGVMRYGMAKSCPGCELLKASKEIETLKAQCGEEK